MLSFEILHMGKTIKINKSKLNMRKLILNIWHGFEEDFNEKDVKPRFLFDNDFAESNKIYLDYKTFSTALFNLLDNTVKYVKQGTEVCFELNVSKEKFELIIKMQSLFIKEDELPRLFDLGFRGNNSQEFDGQGVGMFIFKKAMDLNDFDITINPDYSSTQTDGEKQYTFNKFIISWQLK